MIKNFRKSGMGNILFDGQFSGMRKPQEFDVYPISADSKKTDITIQSDTRLGLVNLDTGLVRMTQSHPNGAHNPHLMLDRLIKEYLPKEELDALKTAIRGTAGTIGNGCVFADNIGAALV